jgi:hypothetical protein
VKPLAEFAEKARRRDKRDSTCKSCVNEGFKRQVECLSDAYIAAQLRLNGGVRPSPELIALKREQLLVKRLSLVLKKELRNESI